MQKELNPNIHTVNSKIDGELSSSLFISCSQRVCAVVESLHVSESDGVVGALNSAARGCCQWLVIEVPLKSLWRYRGMGEHCKRFF